MALVTQANIVTTLEMAGVTVSAAGLAFLTLWQPWIEGRIKEFLKWNVEQDTYTEYYPVSGVNRFFDGDPIYGGYDLLGGKAVARQRGNISRQILPLREVPVRSVTSIYENPGAWGVNTDGTPVFGAGNLLSKNTYYLDTIDLDYSWTGFVYRINGLWSSQVRTIKVTYVAGLTAGEIESERPAIKAAAVTAVSQWFISCLLKSKILGSFGLVSQVGIKDFSVSYDHTALLALIGSPANYDLPPAVKQMLEPYINFNRQL